MVVLHAHVSHLLSGNVVPVCVFSGINTVGIDIVTVAEDNFTFNLLRKFRKDFGDGLGLFGSGAGLFVRTSEVFLGAENHTLGFGNDLIQGAFDTHGFVGLEIAAVLANNDLFNVIRFLVPTRASDVTCKAPAATTSGLAGYAFTSVEPILSLRFLFDAEILISPGKKETSLRAIHSS